MFCESYSLAPLLAVLAWAGNFVVTKFSTTVIEPAPMAFYRSLVAALVMTPFLLVPTWNERRRIRPHLPKLAVLGLLGMSLYQGLSYFAAETSSATNMGIINSVIPLATLGFSHLLLREGSTIGTHVGAVVSLAGLLWLMGKGHPGSLLTQGVGSGDCLILAASVLYALYGVLLRRWRFPFSAWQSLYVQTLLGGLFLLPVFRWAPSSPIDRGNIPVILYAGIVASVLAPFWWMKGVEEIGPNRTSVFMNLLPVMTALIAVLILRERLALYHLVGGIITLTGVLIAQKWNRPLGAQK